MSQKAPTPKTKALPQREIRTRSVWWGYVIAVAGTALGVSIRWTLLQAIGYLPLYITFYPVVIAAAVVGGTRPGFVATILSALAVDLWFTQPVGTLSINLADGVAMGFFVVVNVGISILGGRLKAKSEALQESEALLHLTLQATGIGAFDRNLETDANTWTPELEAMHGLKPGQFGRTGAAWEQLIHPDDRHIAFASVDRALVTFEPVEAEWRVVWPDGSVHWVMARFQAFPRSATRPPRLVGINIDITARNMAAEALRQREEWFRTIAGAIPQLTWIARPDGYLFWFNNRCFEYTGATQEQLEGWGWQNALDPEVRPMVLKRWRHSVATGEPYEMEFLVRGADGAFRPFLHRAVPLRNKQGRVELWFGASMDITDLRERERAVRRQARLIDLAPAATIVLRRDGTITFWSHGAEQLYGWTAAEAVGRRSSELLRTEGTESFETRVAGLQKGGTWSGELRHHDRKGNQLVVESYWLAELNAGGELEEILESNTDITERKRLQEHLEDEVQARTAEMRRALAELEYMSYSMVHDMRAPLRAMQNFAHILQEKVRECQHPPAVDYLRRIGESAIRVDRLITDALNYNRVVREQVILTPVNVGKLLRDIIDSYPNLHPTVADITLEFEALWVRGNESLLTQCFGNLLDNAVKFVARGVRPSVRLWSEEIESPALGHAPSSNMVRVWIEDNGIGIPADSQEKIFRMFQRMHGEGEYPGTGIGLAIVQKTVERMNGHLGLQSTPGRGSKFWIELPKPLEMQRLEPAAAPAQ